MSGFIPNKKYDPSNPISWLDNRNKFPPQGHVFANQQPSYGPIRENYSQGDYVPDMSRPKVNPSQQQSNKTNIYVSGFPTNWSGANLRDLFKTYGAISEVNVITKDSTEENRGVAFVHFSKNKSAADAVNGLNNAIPNSCACPLTVRFANANRNVTPEVLKTMRVNISKTRPTGWFLESSMNIYICQLPSDITEESLRKMFEPFGKITKMKIMNVNEKGSSAFVHYEIPEEAIKAVADMDGFVIEGKEIAVTVRFANINRSKIPDWFTEECIKNMQTTANVYVSQIPPNWTEKELSDLFSPCGPISEVKMLHRKDSSGGVAFVHFENSISACRAIARLNDTKPDENSKHSIIVTFARMDAMTFDKITEGRYARSNPIVGNMNVPPPIAQNSYQKAPTFPANDVPYNTSNTGYTPPQSYQFMQTRPNW